MTLRSALIVQIQLPTRLAAIRARDGKATSPGLPAHVTILFPFIPLGDLDASIGAALTKLAAAREPFWARFAQAQRQELMVWLLPAQPEPFLELTAAVVGQWPMYRPYEGAFDSVIPHLTLVDSGTDEIEGATLEALERGSFEVLVDELQLIGETGSGGWREVDRFRLGK